MPQLQELLTEVLRDLYDAEKQLVKALPKLARAASTAELKQAFNEHLEVTKGQVARIEQVFEAIGERAKSKPCKAMKGLVEEAQEIISEHEKGPFLDSALICAAQKVEHYEIAGYGTVRAIAKTIGQREAVQLLQETLKEEEQTDKLLTGIALRIQKEMKQSEGSPEKAEAKGSSSKGGSGSGKSSKGGSSKGGSNNGGKGSQVTTDHETIREWAEERGGKPACVSGTGKKKGDVGMIQLDFPGFSGAGSLKPISWDDWFQSFDNNGLALLYQEKTARGQKSNFNKLVSRETAAAAEKGGRGR